MKVNVIKDLISESNVLGEESFGKFYPSHGFEALHKIIHSDPESLTDSKILTDMGNELTLTEFFDTIEKLKIQKNLLTYIRACCPLGVE